MNLLKHDDPCLFCEAARTSRRLSIVMGAIGAAFVLLVALILFWAAGSLLLAGQ